MSSKVTSHRVRGTADRPITPLPRPTSRILRSSLVIPTFPQVLSELIQNSLDAGATRIDTYLDLSRGEESLRVVDDGSGISRRDSGRIGRRGESSKGLHSGLGSVGTFGFRGEALSSVASLGMLEITSKVAEKDESYTKIIKSEKVLYQDTASKPIRGHHGTVVVVKDLFHNIPVRQLAMSETSPALILASCRKIIETFALSRPGMKWTLWEERSIGTSEGGLKQVLAIHGGRNSAAVFRSVYGAAAVERVQNIRVKAGKRRIDGFISLEGMVHKNHQHLYVNGYPLQRSDLHQAISQRFAQSRFSAMTSENLYETPEAIRRSPRRLVRHPVYVLNITVPPEEVDVAYNPQKSILGYKNHDSLIAFVLAVVDEFLKKHLFSTGTEQPSPPGTPTPQAEIADGKSASKHLSAMFQTPQNPRQRIGSPERPDDKDADAPCCHSADCSRTGTTDKWVKKRRLEVSAAPGSTMKWVEELISRHADYSMGDEFSLTDNAYRFRDTRSAPDLNDWSSVMQDITFPTQSLSKARVLGQVDQKFIACILNGQQKGSSALQPVLVMIDQHAADERVLVEDILEQLCSGFLHGDIPTNHLEGNGVRLVMSKEEDSVLRRPGVLDILRRWGISLNLEANADPDNQQDYTQVSITAVSKVLSSRLGRKEGSDMRRLLQTYLPFLDEHQNELETFLSSSGTEEQDWERVIRFMPQEMLELANSKACRSAIMFQDVLTLDQCERLVHRLSGTRNAFICAHGRPSLVPLVSMPREVVRGKRKIDWSALSQR